MIRPSSVICLGVVQLISWGVAYYLIGVFGDAIGAELRWSREIVHGGFSAALLVMGLSSPLAGSLIDRRGGRHIMMLGAALNAAGCASLALCHSITLYYVAWVLLGLGMRLTLYDAAFAALARIGGPQSRRPMSQITLLGGLASSVFWPIGYGLMSWIGWRGALGVYAVFAISAIPFLLTLPEGRYDAQAVNGGAAAPAPLAKSDRDRAIAGSLYAFIVMLANFLAAALSAHMIPILAGLGLAAGNAVLVSSLRGIGQSLARLCEVMFGRLVHPLVLNIIAASLLPICFAAGLWSGVSTAAAITFAFVYGAGNGLLTITRGTLPLALFDHRTYGSFVGRLLTPSFLLAAAAPIIYAATISRYGEEAAIHLSLAVAVCALVAALALAHLFGDKVRSR